MSPHAETFPIVQYWNAEPVPAEVRELLDTFARRNPGARHLLFGEAEAAAFVARHLGTRELRAFEACAVPAMQADYFRYCAILTLGGVYADADYRCVASVHPLVEGLDGGQLFYRDRIVIRDRRFKHVLNGFFAFRAPGHPLLRLVLEIATVAIEERVSEAVWATTGPGIFTALSMLRDAGSIDTFLGWTDGRDARAARSLCEVAGGHERVALAFEGVRLSPDDEARAWIRQPGLDLAYKRTQAHWTNHSASIFR